MSSPFTSNSTADVDALLSKHGFNDDVALSMCSIYIKKLLATEACQTYVEQQDGGATGKADLISKFVAVWVTCVLSGFETSLFTRTLSQYKQVFLFSFSICFIFHFETLNRLLIDIADWLIVISKAEKQPIMSQSISIKENVNHPL